MDDALGDLIATLGSVDHEAIDWANVLRTTALIHQHFHYEYPGAIHQLLHARPNPVRFHVRGYKEEGSTTTPFDMVVLNETSRYHIAMDALRRARRPVANAAELTAECEQRLAEHRAYVTTHFEDLPEIRDWTFAP